MIDKIITEMTQEDFKQVPWIGDADFRPSTGQTFNSIVIIPTGELHESGYMCMDYVLVSNDDFKPICRVSGNSDVLEIDGIGGYGMDWLTKGEKNADGKYVIEPKGWKIDCLPCGYLRLFAREEMMLDKNYLPLSSFEIYAI